MLRRVDLQILAEWCRRRRMCWSPGRSEDAAPALLLEPRGRGDARPMLLVVRAGEWCLVDQDGDTLATASDLPALLDALDGGVADPVWQRPAIAHGGLPAAVAWAA